jgi:hypothetical protein
VSDIPNCYAVRRLNPFLGVMEVVEIGAARALSTDGRYWQIQVEAEQPEHTWRSEAPGHGTIRFFRAGDWSAERGLSRVPANPLLDLGAMRDGSERMAAVLEHVQAQLPFPLTDRFEYWLFDAGGRPLALLAATVEQGYCRDIHADRWQAGLQGNPLFDRDSLERQVHDAAGPVPRRRWYERCGDGSGRPLDGGAGSLPAEAFPALPLRSHWPDAEEQARAQDYLHRLAPRLLALDGLDVVLRRELEQAACRQALQVADHYGLYPEVLQPELLAAARVEARLRLTTG